MFHVFLKQHKSRNVIKMLFLITKNDSIFAKESDYSEENRYDVFEYWLEKLLI